MFLEPETEKGNCCSIEEFEKFYTTTLSIAESILSSSKGREVVLFIGSTGSGKSTLLNFLSGFPLYLDDNNEIRLQDPCNPEAFPIGTTSVSETSYPKFIEIKNTLFYDTPGLEDTRGILSNIINAAFFKNIIEKANSLRFVFVIGQDEITAGRGKSFFQTYKIIKNFINSNSIEDYSLIVVTKSVKSNRKDLDSYLKMKITKNDIEKFTPWMGKKNIVPMSFRLNDHEKEKIGRKIMKLVPISGIKVNIKALLQDDATDYISSMLKLEIRTIIKNHKRPELTTNNSIPEIDYLINYYQTLYKENTYLSFYNSKIFKILKEISSNSLIIGSNLLQFSTALTHEQELGALHKLKTKIIHDSEITAEKSRYSILFDQYQKSTNKIKNYDQTFNDYECKINEAKMKIQFLKEALVKSEEKLLNVQKSIYCSNEFCPEENVRFKIKNLNSQNVLNSWGCETGYNSVTVQLDDDTYYDHRIWIFIKSKIHKGYYMIKNIYSNNVVCLWSDRKTEGECRMQYEDTNDDRKLWRFKPYEVSGYFNVVSLCSGLHLNCWADRLGQGSVTLEFDSSNFRSHRAWIFLRV